MRPKEDLGGGTTNGTGQRMTTCNESTRNMALFATSRWLAICVQAFLTAPGTLVLGWAATDRCQLKNAGRAKIDAAI